MTELLKAQRMTPGEVAKLLDVTEATLANWRSAGRGPLCVRVGRQNFYFAMMSKPTCRTKGEKLCRSESGGRYGTTGSPSTVKSTPVRQVYRPPRGTERPPSGLRKTNARRPSRAARLRLARISRPLPGSLSPGARLLNIEMRRALRSEEHTSELQ